MKNYLLAAWQFYKVDFLQVKYFWDKSDPFLFASFIFRILSTWVDIYRDCLNQ